LKAGFFTAIKGLQADGVAAPRSTGSLLKPFLYGLMLDRGEIHPSTLLRDVPIQFGSYAPVNADSTFGGMVPACEALLGEIEKKFDFIPERVPPEVLFWECIGMYTQPAPNALKRALGVKCSVTSPGSYPAGCWIRLFFKNDC